MRIIYLVVGLLVLANLAFLNYVYVVDKNTVVGLEAKLTEDSRIIQALNSRPGESVGITALATAAATCPQSCISLINQTDKTVKTTTVINQTTAGGQKGEYIIPLGSGSITELNTWKDINTAQATVNLSNFGRIKETYFEAVMHIPNQQGEVRLRLYDTSTPYIYAGNVLRTTSQTGELQSVKIGLQPGQKTYKVQMYTTISAAILDMARIRIVTE